MLLFICYSFYKSWLCLQCIGREAASEYDLEHLSQVPIWNKCAVSFHQLGDAALELSSVHISTQARKLVGMFKVEGKDNIKEELL